MKVIMIIKLMETEIAKIIRKNHVHVQYSEYININIKSN
jgi:hypothetical protein